MENRGQVCVEINTVVFFQCFYLNFRVKQVDQKLDKITAELAELRQLELARR